MVSKRVKNDTGDPFEVISIITNMPSSNAQCNNTDAIGTKSDDDNTNENSKQDDSTIKSRAVELEEANHKFKAQIESLEREIGLKRILEQNLRDLQSQYYESVKELDEFRSSQELKTSQSEAEICDLKKRLESESSNLSDKIDIIRDLKKELNDIKESSQLLEKKYHRAKKIIKDMQLREQSFTRREQLYQQKLDEIEFELSQLIESINSTIKNDAINYYSLIRANKETGNGGAVKKGQLNIFGLIKKIIDNFNQNQESQNPQIKQRVSSILEQKLASLIASSQQNNSSLSVTNDIIFQDLIENNNNTLQRNHHQHHSNATASSNHLDNSIATSGYISLTTNNRASCPADVSIPAPPPPPPPPPAMPHPIGVTTTTTNKFYSQLPLGSMTTGNGKSLDHDLSPLQQQQQQPASLINPSSYPSSISLNSLNNNNSSSLNNNNIATLNNNTIISKAHLQQQQNNSNQQQLKSDLSSNLNVTSLVGSVSSQMLSTTSTISEDVDATQDPYKTDEWHDKPVSEWTTTQVSTWLLALGLDQYITKFEDRNVNGQSLINLDSTLLKGFGVLNSNDRNLLKKKIRELKAEMEKERKLVEKKLQKDKFKSKFLI